MAHLQQQIMANQDTIRIAFFFFGYLFFFALGILFPFREQKASKNKKRWISNTLLTFLNSSILKVLVPYSLVYFSSTYAQEGLLRKLQLNEISLFILGILLLDLSIYWQHRFFHTNPILWKLHRVHHSDTEFDTTTALRFHTLEIFFSYLFKIIIILSFGITPITVITFEILLNFSAMFNHANIDLPFKTEKIISKLLVTPRFHRVHHSIHKYQTNSNYGFFFSFWDPLFDSFQPSLDMDQRSMTIGLKTFRTRKQQNLSKLLLQPFSKDIL